MGKSEVASLLMEVYLSWNTDAVTQPVLQSETAIQSLKFLMQRVS